MTKLLIESIVELIVVSPLIYIWSNKRDFKWKQILLLVAYYAAYKCILFLPILHPELKFIQSTWNWSGKIYAITGSLIFYFLFSKAFTNYDYITFKQNSNSLQAKFKVIAILFIFAFIFALICFRESAEKFEYFMFQFTMPGIDEEIAYRGIMLGLLSNSLRPKVHIGSLSIGNPAVLITSVLFGLAHSFGIDNEWNISQNWFEFINVFLVGLLLGWMTIKSGSILMSILSHNLINTIPKLIFWI